MVDHGTIHTAAKYGPALMTAPLALMPAYVPAIVFGMIAGWFAIAGVMVEQQRTVREIRRAMIVSVLIGGGGALGAAFAVERMELTPIEAALIAFGIAFGGVKSIKVITGAVWRVLGWVVDNLIDDAEKRGRERQNAHKMMLENDKSDRARMNLPPSEKTDDYV